MTRVQEGLWEVGGHKGRTQRQEARGGSIKINTVMIKNIILTKDKRNDSGRVT